MGIKIENNAASTLAVAVGTSDTSISLASGGGSLFPTLGAGDYFWATLISSLDPSYVEIVKVTARTGDSLTVLRAQEGTAAKAFSTNDKFEMRITAQTMRDYSDAANLTGVLSIAQGGTGQTTEAGVRSALNVPTRTGGDASGIWGISITGSAPTLTTGRTIGMTGDVTWTSAAFDGSGNVTGTATLANSGVSAGTYRSITVDAKGRVTGGTNPTTLSGYGITDAQPLDADLTSIAGLSGTSGFLKKTAANTWSLDTNAYLTGNQSISISGDASGSGATSISLTLSNSGVTAGTYTKVTVDAKGRVTTGTSLASSDVTTALGYTPLSNATSYLPLSGGTITGTALQVGTAFTYDNPGGWNANIVAAGSTHARFRLRATSFSGSGDRETYLWLDNSTSPATGMYSTASTFAFGGSIGTVQVSGNTVLHAGNYSTYSPSYGYFDDYTRGNYRVIADYGGYSTWYIRPDGRWVFARGHDWTVSFDLNLGSGTAGANTAWAQLGQVNSNSSNGTWRGVRFMQFASGAAIDGDVRARRYYLNDDTNYITQGAAGTIRSQTSTGYVDIGSINTSHAHLQTDRPSFYFNTTVLVNGEVHRYSDNALHLHTGNYTSYVAPVGGGWYGSGLPGSRWYGYSVNDGEIVMGRDLPNTGQMGFLIDGCYIAGENNGFWSLASDNTWGSRRGMYWDGSYLNFTTNSATAYFSNALIGGNQILHAGNYTSYSPSLSGNYKNISVGGLYSRYNYNDSAWIVDSTSAFTLSPDFGQTTVAMHQSHGLFNNWATTLTMSGYERYGAYQISGDYNASTPALAMRNYNQGIGGWTPWTRILSSANYNSYSPTLTGSGASGTWGINVTGNAATISGQANSATITASTGVNGNHIVLRDGNGYIYANHINFNTTESENPSINSFITSNGDGWSRKSTLDHVKNSIRGVANGTWSIDITGNAGTAYGLAVHGGRNNEANKVVRTDGNGYLQTGYINSSNGDENNASSPARVWGTNGSDSYLRTYQTSALSVGSATNGRYVYDNGAYSGAAAYREASSMHVYYAYLGRLVYNNGAYSGSGWVEPSDLGVRYANSAGSVSGGLTTSNYSSYALPLSGGTVTGPTYFRSNQNHGGSSPPLQAYSNDGGGAIMSFHRGGYYAINMGLDSDNVFRIGGWSASTNRLQMDMSGNLTMAGLVRAGTNFYADQNYGYGLVGVYASTRYQGVFAMGDSYKLPADGTSAGNLYGIAWSYPSAGGVAGNLDSHGMLVLINGGFGSCMSYSIKASGNVTAYSDERLKTNWRPMPESFVERLAAVKVGIYDRTDGERITQVGVSAQSLQKLLPEAITKAADEMGTLSVSYGNAAMASAVELAKEIVALKKELAEIKYQVHKGD
jgi:hypothetical protein